MYALSCTAARVGVFDKKVRLNKFAFLSGEVQLEKAESSSLLNNCMDEIVYFFSKLDNYRIVVFEDLDRLNTPEIFVKLREINKIVNNNLTESHPLRFIYAVRDDIFTGADARTKFFDFIVPVIPFMDNGNAYSLLNSRMKPLLKDAEECLRGTAAYINDMRCLQNIVNEFRVFSQTVDNRESLINLYALVFYKNSFAHDYSLIDKKLSVLYSLVHDYRTLRLHEEFFSDLDAEEKRLINKIEFLQTEQSTTPEDARRKVISAFIPEHLWQVITFMAYTNYHYYPQDYENLIQNEDIFLELFNSSNLKVGNNNSASIILSSEQQQQIIDDYYLIKNEIEENRNDSYLKAREELKAVRKKLRVRNAISLSELVLHMKRKSFGDIVQRYIENLASHDFISSVQQEAIKKEMRYGGTDALYFLMSKGYIDQHFMRSRSIFHQGGLTASDNEYVKNVALGMSCQTANLDYPLDDVPAVIRELKVQVLLHHDGAIHHQVISHMLSHSDGQLKHMAATLFSKPAEDVFLTLEILYSRFTSLEVFISLMTVFLDNYGHAEEMLMLMKNRDADSFQMIISIYMVACTRPSRIEDVTSYRKYVEKLGSKVFFHVDPSLMQTLLNHINEIGVKYQRLSPPIADEEFTALQFIGDHFLFEINPLNVNVILYAFLHENNTSIKNGKEYPWTLASENNLNVSQYFRSNINEFVQEVFLQSSEKEDAVRDILAISALEDSLRFEIVSNMSFTLDNIEDIDCSAKHEENGEVVSLKDAFFEHDRVTVSWESLLDYISGDCNLGILSEYIKHHADALSKGRPSLTDNIERNAVYEKILCNDTLDDNTYALITSVIDIQPEDFDNKMSVKNILRLIRDNRVQLNKDVYEIITSYFVAINSESAKVFASWFGRFKDEFMSEPAFYLHKDESDVFFASLLKAVIHSASFATTERAQVLNQFAANSSDEESLLAGAPRDVLLSAFEEARDESQKVQLLIVLISAGLHDKGKLREMFKTVSQNEFSKIFINKNEATIVLSTPELHQPLLDALKEARIIKKI